MSHFYEQLADGVVVPRHFTQMKDRPDLRPTRITDVKKWWKEGRNVRPSVTTVQNVLAKPQLEIWKIEQYLIIAYKKGMDVDAYDPDEWTQEVKRLTELKLDKAPSAGTDFHKLMEQFWKEKLPKDNKLYSLCESVAEKITNETGCFWLTEYNFVSNDGYGGQIDLFNLKWLIDYKTKQTADKFKPGKMAYDDHRMQLAAYRQAIAPTARCANVFVCLENGAIDFHEHSEAELEKGWELFKHALAIWKLRHEDNEY